MILYLHFSDNKSRSRYLSHDNKFHPAHIAWKFDYRPGNYYLTSLKLRMKFQITKNDSLKIQWFIQTLPTRKNPNPEFKPFTFPLKERNVITYYNFEIVEISDSVLDLTELIRDEPGFILKACLYINNRNEEIQLFRKKIDEVLSDENFSIDFKMELKPNIICEQNNSEGNNMIKNLVLNDRITSDFIIKLIVPKEIESEDSVEKLFYVHSTVLGSKSDYFQALFNSNMLESQNKCLKLVDISYFILEKLLLFIYTNDLNDLENVDKFEDWVDLLYAASRFLMPQLIQVCELSIRKFVNFENVEKVEKIAYECGALQLAKYCEMFEIKKDDALQSPRYCEMFKIKKDDVKK